MIPFDDAYQIAMESVRPLGTESSELTQSLGRVLAQDILADMPMPPFDKSMVDGFACRRADLHAPLTIVETIAAGYMPERSLGPGECARIMTGAPVPDGADCVFMVEHSEETTEHVRFTKDDTPNNITPRASDVAEGDVLIRSGHRIGPSEIAVMASMGVTNAKISERPRVAVIATGDELVEPIEVPGPAQIRNSNAYQLCAQLSAIGCEASYLGIAKDTEESLDDFVRRATRDYDVALFSGGVSMGEFDLVPKVWKAHGIDIRFDRVAVQPGKPTTFAVSDDLFCFGLPGNPVATFVMFELIVKPFLLAMMGHDYRPPRVNLPLAEPFTRKSGARKFWMPVVTTDEGAIRRVEYHGSAHINALCNAEGLAPFPQGITEMDAGTLVEVRMIR